MLGRKIGHILFVLCGVGFVWAAPPILLEMIAQAKGTIFTGHFNLRTFLRVPWSILGAVDAGVLLVGAIMICQIIRADKQTLDDIEGSMCGYL